MNTHEEHVKMDPDRRQPGADARPAADDTAAREYPDPPTAAAGPSAPSNPAQHEAGVHDPGASRDVGSRQPSAARRRRESGFTAGEDPAGASVHRDSDIEGASSNALFADDELAGLRVRWDSVQAGFVDDPRECVQRADGLVSDVLEQLTTGFAQARARLERQWARGEQVSTEDMRVALKQYREFFERLLAA